MNTAFEKVYACCVYNSNYFYNITYHKIYHNKCIFIYVKINILQVDGKLLCWLCTQSLKRALARTKQHLSVDKHKHRSHKSVDFILNIYHFIAATRGAGTQACDYKRDRL